MLSKNKIKFIQSLSRKKNRTETGLFVAEGEKLVQELLDADFKIQTIVTTEIFRHRFSNHNCELIETTYAEIKKISTQKTPQEVVAIAHIPQQTNPISDHEDNLVLALDGIQDPGNLGTIIRLASWFGIQQVICSNHTVDCYNPKVIQATMGAIAHVQILYTDLEEFLNRSKKNGRKVYGTFLDGENIYKSQLTEKGVIVMGNEGQGISPEIEKLVDQKLHIPSFSTMKVESLNVSMATAIICSEFKRNRV